MALKERTCRYCKSRFVPERPGARACSIECATAIAEKIRAKAEGVIALEARKSARQARQKLKSLHDHIKGAQAACNAYVRARDEGKPCISCGAILSRDGHGGGFDAGHYRSRGASPQLRFDEANIHGQCKRCNRYLGGNVAAMRIGLRDRIGDKELERLECDNSSRKWTKEELDEIRRQFILMRKRIETR